MKPVAHPSNTHTFAPPSDWDDKGGKLELPVMKATRAMVAGVEVFASFWKPTDDELMCLLRGGQVQLVCVGGQPAVTVVAVDDNGGPAGNVVLLN